MNVNVQSNETSLQICITQGKVRQNFGSVFLMMRGIDADLPLPPPNSVWIKSSKSESSGIFGWGQVTFGDGRTVPRSRFFPCKAVAILPKLSIVYLRTAKLWFQGLWKESWSHWPPLLDPPLKASTGLLRFCNKSLEDVDLTMCLTWPVSRDLSGFSSHF